MVAVAASGYGWRGRGQAVFPAVTGQAAGNQLPGITGYTDRAFRPGPGYSAGGQLGGKGDGNTGTDPRAPKMEPDPRSSWTASWSEGQAGNPSGPPLPPLPYGGLGSFRGRGDYGNSQQTGIYGNPLSGGPDERQSFRRNGFIGFNDKLTAKDRHVYWDTGHQRTGTTFVPEGAPPGTYNNPREQPPAPELRAVNRTVSYQKGSDATRNQDDLTRPYTWLGEQGARWTPVNGGVPGLYQPYGTRGGVPYPIVSPVGQGQPGDGPHVVSDGPPHGLHSRTPWKGGAQIIARFSVIPQTRPVRIDRPSNSPQAGQSYSQTVLPQGASRVRPGRTPASRGQGPMQHAGRGWAGRTPGGSQG